MVTQHGIKLAVHLISSYFGDLVADALQKNFNRLVNARYVERCPAHEPFLAPPAEEETAAKKRGAKSAKVVYFVSVPLVTTVDSLPDIGLLFLGVGSGHFNHSREVCSNDS
ncbi:hypothetical protein U1Q18_031626 [Sarracenia purpurea var. burkii]